MEGSPAKSPYDVRFQRPEKEMVKNRMKRKEPGINQTREKSIQKEPDRKLRRKFFPALGSRIVQSNRKCTETKRKKSKAKDPEVFDLKKIPVQGALLPPPVVAPPPPNHPV